MTSRHDGLPSLHALSTFEASARHRSLKRAADELDVTPGAVSRQIEASEEELGSAPFDRGPSPLALPPGGLLLRACRGGQGVAVGWHRLVEPPVAAGGLVRFTSLTAPAPGSCHLTWNADATPRGAAAAFRDWSLGEVAGPTEPQVFEQERKADDPGISIRSAVAPLRSKIAVDIEIAPTKKNRIVTTTCVVWLSEPV